MFKPLAALALLLLTAPALAGECEANFRKSGNPLVMTTYSSAVTVPSLATGDALAQMRGIMVAEKMDVMPKMPMAAPCWSSSGNPAVHVRSRPPSA